MDWRSFNCGMMIATFIWSIVAAYSLYQMKKLVSLVNLEVERIIREKHEIFKIIRSWSDKK